MVELYPEFPRRAALFWLAVTALEHGEWLASQGREEDARPLVDEARELFEQLKAKPWLDRVAAAIPLRTGVTG